MPKQRFIIGAVIGLFAWSELIHAASISTRVRVLEGKVAKFDNQIRAESSARKAYEHKLDEKLGSVEQLQRQVDKLSKQLDGKNGGEDRRYTFP